MKTTRPAPLSSGTPVPHYNDIAPLAESLSAGAKNVAFLLAHGRNPELHGMSRASLREAHAAGIINWNLDYTGQGYTLAIRGVDMAKHLGWY